MNNMEAIPIGVRGVRFDRTRAKWRAVVSHDWRNYHIGYYLTKRDAIIAYNSAAQRIKGIDAKLNPIPPEPKPTKID